MRRWTIAVGVFGLGIAAGILTLRAAREHPGHWFGATSDLAGVALLAPAWTLIACGLATWARRPAGRSGLLLAAAGFAWFVPEWNNPELGSALAFTIGLALYAACPPLVAHAVLAYPGSRLASRLDAAAVTLAYAGGVAVLGVLPALVFDPQAEGCAPCPDNLLLISAHGQAAEDDLGRAGVYLGLLWAGSVGAARGRADGATLAGDAPCPRRRSVYLGLVAATFAVFTGARLGHQRHRGAPAVVWPGCRTGGGRGGRRLESRASASSAIGDRAPGRGAHPVASARRPAGRTGAHCWRSRTGARISARRGSPTGRRAR